MNNTFYQSFFQEGIYRIPEKTLTLNPTEDPIEEDVIYLGENNQKTIVFIDVAEYSFGSDQDKDFLSKILGAIKLTFNDIVLINIDSNPSLNFPTLENKLIVKKIISFGFDLNNWFGQSKITKYKLSLIGDLEILYADSLQEIQEDKNKKIKLWEELKKLLA